MRVSFAPRELDLFFVEFSFPKLCLISIGVEFR